MNFYKHHLGDYDSATTHLSWDEDMAYSRLLRVYYRTEKPIPLDPAAAFRLIRAVRPSEKKACAQVLSEFFQKTSEGWVNKRADEEIAKANEKAEKNREVGAKGGRPKKTMMVSENNHDGFQNVRSHSESETLSRLQTPDSNKEEDNLQKTVSFVGLAPDDTPLESEKPNAKDNTRREQLALAKSVLEFLNKKTGRHYQPVAANLDFIIARIREGATRRQLFQVIAKKNREWSPDPNMAQYLRPATLFNRSKFAQYVGELIPEPEMTETKEANHG